MLESAEKFINYALLADSKPEGIPIGSSHPELLAPVVTPDTIRSLSIALGGIFKFFAGMSLIGGTLIDIPNICEALNRHDYPQALSWAMRGLTVDAVNFGIIGAVHWGQIKLRPKRDKSWVNPDEHPHNFSNFHYSRFISTDRQYPHQNPFRKFLPFLENDLKQAMQEEIKCMRPITAYNLHPISEN